MQIGSNAPKWLPNVTLGEGKPKKHLGVLFGGHIGDGRVPGQGAVFGRVQVDQHAVGRADPEESGRIGPVQVPSE